MIGIKVEEPYVPDTTPEFARLTITFPGPVPDSEIPVPDVIEVTTYDEELIGVKAYEPTLLESTKVPLLPSRRLSSDEVNVRFTPSKILSSEAFDVMAVPERDKPAKLGESEDPKPSVVLAVAPDSVTQVVPFPTIIFPSVVARAAIADKVELDV